jgi:uncharacterized protein (DUF2236 family)
MTGWLQSAVSAPRAVAGRTQRLVGELLRAKVAGPDAQREAAQIWGKPGTRWFTPDDPIWRVHQDASMFAGGICALLLQSLHPAAMAGVAGHSGYRGDPWGRLQRTSRYLAVTTYGTVSDAEAAIARVREIHRRVRGKDAEGRSYRADDPNLLRWVHIAESYSFLRAHQTYGRRPLARPESDTYVRQSAIPARILGATDLPGSVAELEQALADYRPELEATDDARQAARFLLLQPPLPLLARPGYATLSTGALALLPRWALSMLWIPIPAPLRPFARGIGAVGTGTARWAMAGLRDEPPADASRAPAGAGGAQATG